MNNEATAELPTIEAEIAQIDDFLEREFAYYLHEHRHPLNRATHMLGIPLLIGTAVTGLAKKDWRWLVGGQVVGWSIQMIGHRIEGNKPALLKRKISFLMGPLMVLTELGNMAGLRLGFVDRARQRIHLP